MILNRIRAIRVLCYANELMLVRHIESQPFQGGQRVRYPYRLRRLVISSNRQRIDQTTRCRLLNDTRVARNRYLSI